MSGFRAPVGDILYTLDACGADTLPDWDAELVAQIAESFAAFAEAEIAPINASGDTQGARLENGRVRMPDGFRAVFDRYRADGWTGLTAPETHGGQGLGAVALAVTSEIFSGANHSLQMVTGLVPGAIRVLMEFGTEAQCAALIPPLAEGRWISTMCLTEPGAGSDLARIRCRAERDGDGWRISGEKIFISGGDQDLSEGIFHLVLARTGDADSGVKGLSLFACLSDRADGTRNSVTVTRIEEKMGLHAAPTCQMVFDGAEAQLIGAEGQGLRAMFTMMNHARIDVALQGVAHAARAHAIAASYCAERVQGRGADGAPVTLDQHSDVRHMLDGMQARALLGRAIAHTAIITLERGDDPDLVEFLTPIAKHFGSEIGTEAADLGIQCLGGYGYLSEYGIEQIWRDARICRIYEGANGIHALTLAGRLMRGPAVDRFAAFLDRNLTCSGTRAAWDAACAVLRNTADPAPLARDFMELSTLALCRSLASRFEGHEGQAAIASYLEDRAGMAGLIAARMARRGQ
ncbi:acyl-CoA dehydrogenase family protein [Lutimaribacter saemankumensis]|uniref:Acyl-CoA dehydrogenase n=1 Tax=Lutimaribacter saemankumensis TaxID=490829 RepID=A0A1G8JLP2_9RHOB|nr:acyl-CoA dehydrogenase family protein [Lutimaribacter saemankumensis]SDI32072.1 hypothetical protein SAMN05421850_102190 [Lutimaribacter saemankumensis]